MKKLSPHSYKHNKQNDQNIKKPLTLIKDIPTSTKEILNNLTAIFVESNDFIIKEITICSNPFESIIIAFLQGMIDDQSLNNDILKPIMDSFSNNNLASSLYGEPILFNLKQRLLHVCMLNEVSNFEDSVMGILSGNVLIYTENTSKALVIEMTGWEKREVSEPETESVVRGPREAFTESIRTNTTLIRRKIKNPNLKLESLTLGEQTKTEINICYIKGIAKYETITEVKNRLNKINTDAILESSYIEEFIEDAPFSIFPTVNNSEKPDIIAGKILEGRVAIFCDGTPFVLTVPHLFIELIQSSEDYYSRWIHSFFIRFLRIMALIITTMTPAYYVALLTFHQDVIPFKLLLTMYASREGVPFSPMVEALIMIFTFELLREAGVRMPRAVGQAISIVGALVIGDSAVRAGLVSTPMVVVISITAITSFILPQLAPTLLFLRILFLLAANTIGLFGNLIASLILFIHLSKLKSFNAPYLFPFSPLNLNELKDGLLRFPLWTMVFRPKYLTGKYSNKIKTRTRR